MWYKNPGDPVNRPWKKHVIDTAPRPIHGHPADMDGDGSAEVVATAWGDERRVAVFKHQGDPRGPWTMQMLKRNWCKANQVLAADLDRDGRLDVVASAERGSNEVRWWRNLGPAGE